MIVGIWWKFVLDFLNFGFRKFHWKFCEFRSLKFCETERFLNLGLLKSVEIDKLLNLKSLKLKEETFSYRYKKFRCTCIIDLHIRYNFYKILIFWFIRCSVNLYRLITQWYITKQFIAQFIKSILYTVPFKSSRKIHSNLQFILFDTDRISLNYDFVFYLEASSTVFKKKKIPSNRYSNKPTIIDSSV